MASLDTQDPAADPSASDQALSDVPQAAPAPAAAPPMPQGLDAELRKKLFPQYAGGLSRAEASRKWGEQYAQNKEAQVERDFVRQQAMLAESSSNRDRLGHEIDGLSANFFKQQEALDRAKLVLWNAHTYGASPSAMNSITQEVADKQAAFNFIQRQLFDKSNEREAYAHAAMGMIAGLTPPRGATNDQMDKTLDSLSMPSYASPSDKKGGGAAPNAGEEAPVQGPEPSGPERVQQELTQFMHFPEGQIINGALHFSVATEEEAKQLQANLKKYEDNLGFPTGTVITSREGIFKTGMLEYRQLGQQMNIESSRLDLWQKMLQKPAEIQKWEAVLAAAGENSGDQADEMNAFAAAMNANEADRKDIINNVITKKKARIQDLSTERQVWAQAAPALARDVLQPALQAAGMEKQNAIIGGPPGGTTSVGLTEDQFYEQYAKTHFGVSDFTEGWAKKLPKAQAREMVGAYDRLGNGK